MENIVRKGEIAFYKQFLLFSQCFLSYMVFYFLFKIHFKMSSASCFSYERYKILLSGNGLKCLTFFHTTTPFNAPEEEAF